MKDMLYSLIDRIKIYECDFVTYDDVIDYSALCIFMEGEALIQGWDTNYIIRERKPAERIEDNKFKHSFEVMGRFL
jgi:hypothetical protein